MTKKKVNGVLRGGGSHEALPATLAPDVGAMIEDPVTAVDRRRIRAARAEARERVREIKLDSGGAMRDVFRQEVGTAIRSASPFLLALVESLGMSLDALVERMEPSHRWPRSPSLSMTLGVRFRPVRDSCRHFLVGTASGWKKALRLRGFGHVITLMQSGDDSAHLEIVAHSLEVEAWIGPVKFETLFGVLRIELASRLPETLAAACVGMLVGDVVDHATLRGRDWVITEVEDTHPFLGQTLIIVTGSTPYRLPWAR